MQSFLLTASLFYGLINKIKHDLNFCGIYIAQVHSLRGSRHLVFFFFFFFFFLILNDDNDKNDEKSSSENAIYVH